MRAVTATEKYRAVSEGSMSKKEFVRQMRQQYPMYISQFNGYNDTVQILKNKQMLFEASKPAFSGVQVYDDRPALTYSLDALDRGIRAELAVLKLDPASDRISKESLAAATDKAKTNLENDCNHYLNLLSGESKKVDKQDREKEVKRGALDKDTFNDMKKATLKEAAEDFKPHFMYKDGDKVKANTQKDHEDLEKKGYDHKNEGVDPNPPMSEDAKKTLLGKVVGVLNSSHPDITVGIIKDFIRTHYMDLLNGVDIEDEFGEYIDNNYEGPSDMREGEKGIDMSSKDGYIAFIDNENILATYSVEDVEEMARELAMTHHEAGQDQDNFIKSFMMGYKEGGYDTEDQVHEKQGKDHDGDGDIDGDDYMAAKDAAIKKAMGKDEVDENAEAIKFAQFIHAHGLNDQQVKDSEYLQDLYNNYVEMLGEDTDEGYAMKRMQRAHTQDRLAGKKSTYDIAKEKQAEKEKQLKEAIKSIIKKTLSEDVVNEAATNRLSSINDEFSSYAGAQTVINQLENVVTEIEQFHSKTRDKIQKIYDGMENIENDEGLKIGVFIGPSIEAAFRQDLRPVTKKGFTSDLSIPKAKRLDPNLVAQAAQGDIEEIGDAKHTVFTPNN